MNIARNFGEDIALKKLNDLEKNIYLLEDNPYLGITPRYLVFKRQGYQVLILEKDLIFYKINKDKKTNYYLCGRKSTSGLYEYYSRFILIGRQFGSGGHDIGKTFAENLGYAQL